MADIYHSTPLTSNQRIIRLLNVHAANNNDLDEAVSCDLSVIDLDAEHPPFAALTYVWNPDDNTEFASVNCAGQLLPLTCNGYDALKHLRNKLGTFKKIHQIGLMGEIYSEAETVYIWLGSGSPACGRALDFIERASFQRYFTWGSQSVSGKPSGLRMSQAMLDYAWSRMGRIKGSSARTTSFRLGNLFNRNDGPKGISYHDLVELFDNPWIRRMWTYQEVLLASNPVAVVGSHHLQWSLLERGVIFLAYSGMFRQSHLLTGLLEAWTELVLSRDQLSAVRETAKYSSFMSTGRIPQDGNDLHPTQLLRYRDFVIRVGEKMDYMVNKCKWGTLGIFYIAVLGGIAFATALASVRELAHSTLKYKPVNTTSTVLSALRRGPDAIRAIRDCLQACQELGNATCVPTCQSAYDSVEPFANAAYYLVQGYVEVSVDVWKPRKWIIGAAGAFGPLFLLCIILVSIIILLRKSGPIYPPSDTTLNLVKGLCTRSCRERKDKALAMHSVLQRLSPNKLELPDSTKSVENVYKDLSRNIIQTTMSVALLLPAALSGYDNFPSWVPDWSAKPDPFWINTPLFDGQPYDATPGSRSQFGWNKPGGDILLVQGRWLYTIIECYPLIKTNAMYEPQEHGAHLQNVEAILRLCTHRWSPTMLRDIQKIFKMLSETGSSGPKPPQSQQFKRWLSFMMLVRDYDAATVLSLLTEKQTLGAYTLIKVDRVSRAAMKALKNSKFFSFAWSGMTGVHTGNLSEILQTHIAICNCLNEGNKVLFSAMPRAPKSDTKTSDPRQQVHRRKREKDLERSPVTSTEDVGSEKDLSYIGLGCANVQSNDKVTLIGGVRIPLVIRSQESSDSLISPAVIPASMAGHEWINSFGDDFGEFWLS